VRKVKNNGVLGNRNQSESIDSRTDTGGGGQEVPPPSAREMVRFPSFASNPRLYLRSSRRVELGSFPLQTSVG